MSKLGAKKKREKEQWVCFSGAPPEPPPPPPWAGEREYGEEEVKIACELSLLFMLWHNPPKRGKVMDGRWAVTCMEQSAQYPDGSYRHVFWWSMRILRDPKENLDTFRSYLEWKLGSTTPVGSEGTVRDGELLGVGDRGGPSLGPLLRSPRLHARVHVLVVDES